MRGIESKTTQVNSGRTSVNDKNRLRQTENRLLRITKDDNPNLLPQNEKRL